MQSKRAAARRKVASAGGFVTASLLRERVMQVRALFLRLAPPAPGTVFGQKSARKARRYWVDSYRIDSNPVAGVGWRSRRRSSFFSRALSSRRDSLMKLSSISGSSSCAVLRGTRGGRGRP